MDHWHEAPDVPGFTVDPPGARDLDDAIWVERTESGFRVLVSVAAACEFVPKGGALDERALDRVETSYGKTGNRPMLPRAIAEGGASLLPGEPRRVVVTTIDLDKNLAVSGTTVSLGVLRSLAQLSYAEVPAILLDAKHELHTQLQLCVHVAQGLVDRRRAAGAFVFYDLNHGWITTEEGAVKILKDTRETIGHIVVQELMILANSAMAEMCAREEIPIPFRNHTARAHAPERSEIMERLMAGLHEPLRGLEVLQKQVNLVMNRADYGVALKGHYGLNLPAYVHCTSPIRRYPDIIAQRQMIAHFLRLRGENIDFPHTREEIDHLCRVVNSTLEARRAAASDREKARADEQARGVVTGDVNLACLSAKEFERVVKVAVRGGTYLPELTQAFEDRIGQGILNPIDLYFGLLESPSTEEWMPLRKAILDYLLRNPHAAPSVASMACSLREWPVVEFATEGRGPDHARTHAAIARLMMPTEGGRTLITGTGGGRGLKEAKQRALVQLLANAVGHNLPEWEETDFIGGPEATPTVTAVPELSDNPVSALQDFAQARGTVLPSYEATLVGGSDHAPQFACTCAFRGLTVQGTFAASKKIAKKLAAEAMILRLRSGG
jgi:ribonuclease R